MVAASMHTGNRDAESNTWHRDLCRTARPAAFIDLRAWCPARR